MSWLRIYIGLVAFSLLGTLLEKLTGASPGPVAPIAAFATLVAALGAALGPWIREDLPYRLKLLAGVVKIGLAAEIVGVLTGYPFGKYVYTDQWWPTVPLTADSRFPLLLPFAWLLIAGASWLAVPGWGGVRVFWGAVLATLVDVAMEPALAGPLHFWRWTEPGPLPGGAPWMNLAGWFLVSAAAGATLAWLGKEPKRPIPSARIVLGCHTAMVLALAYLRAG